MKAHTRRDYIWLFSILAAYTMLELIAARFYTLDAADGFNTEFAGLQALTNVTCNFVEEDPSFKEVYPCQGISDSYFSNCSLSGKPVVLSVMIPYRDEQYFTNDQPYSIYWGLTIPFLGVKLLIDAFSTAGISISYGIVLAILSDSMPQIH
jgi:hypothetical protein